MPLTSVSERNGGMSEKSEDVAQGSQLRDHKSVNQDLAPWAFKT